jgi:hypothetical protein
MFYIPLSFCMMTVLQHSAQDNLQNCWCDGAPLVSLLNATWHEVVKFPSFTNRQSDEPWNIPCAKEVWRYQVELTSVSCSIRTNGAHLIRPNGPSHSNPDWGMWRIGWWRCCCFDYRCTYVRVKTTFYFLLFVVRLVLRLLVLYVGMLVRRNTLTTGGKKVMNSKAPPRLAKSVLVLLAVIQQVKRRAFGWNSEKSRVMMMIIWSFLLLTYWFKRRNSRETSNTYTNKAISYRPSTAKDCIFDTCELRMQWLLAGMIVWIGVVR